MWTFAGCYLSDWIAYWVGRILGTRLLRIGWFKRSFPPKKILKMEIYYQKYGFYTLMVGRFIPFGVRNLLFITAGISKMHFGRFILSDGIACFISNITLFSIAYTLGKNYKVIFSFLVIYNNVLITILIVFLIGLWVYQKFIKKTN